MIQKSEWRQRLLQLRKKIPKERREEAARHCLERLKSRGRILSFSPISSEIDLGALNQVLKAEGRLWLVPYKIGPLIQFPLHEIDCILVPGLGFDKDKYRIGYGKGYYDQFLAGAAHIWTIGVGFKEQLCEEPLPRDPWDIPVKELLLV
ncbi:MAG: 5-formyltetrahydrofolate cyclo-ligase [Chlamydiales bacterium]